MTASGVTYDCAIEMTTGEIVAHTADCPAVRALAANGVEVATLLGCTTPLPAGTKLHACLAGRDGIVEP